MMVIYYNRVYLIRRSGEMFDNYSIIFQLPWLLAFITGGLISTHFSLKVFLKKKVPALIWVVLILLDVTLKIAVDLNCLFNRFVVK